MKLYRLLTTDGRVAFAERNEAGSYTEWVGEFPQLTRTDRVLTAASCLRPSNRSAVYIIGYNYAADPKAARLELGDDPVVVMKSPNTVIGPEDTIQLPPDV